MKGIEMQTESPRAGKAAYATLGIALLAALSVSCEHERPDLPIRTSLHDASTESEATCRATSEPQALPAEARESSGLARSRRSPNLLWTHNDAGNEPVVFATDTSGRLVARVAVSGARLVD